MSDTTDTISVMTEESQSASMTVTISSMDTSSDTPVSFQKPSRSAVWKHFRRHHWERAVPAVQEDSFIQRWNNF